MNLDRVYVIDFESDGLLDTVSKIWCMGIAWTDKKGKWQVKSTVEPSDMIKVLTNPQNTLVCHNIIQYDIPLVEKILGVKVTASVIDTLGLSYHLYNDRGRRHGLEAWGEDLGTLKPEVDDWENLTIEDYRHRVEEDTKINTKVWIKMLKYLRKIYENNDTQIISYIKYLNFKLECLRYQEENKILIDVEQCKKNAEYLQEICDTKKAELERVMPKIPVIKETKNPYSKAFKKDGTVSRAGEKWFELLERFNLPVTYDAPIIRYNDGYTEPNGGSSAQVKDWLFSLGWKPAIFKDGVNGKVPQLRDDEKQLCRSVIELAEIVPEVKHLQGLSVAQHRLGYLKGFLTKVNERGEVSAWAHGFTKTLRKKHSAPFVNLPKPNTEHGELVRSVMIAPPGYILVGSDVSSLEDKMKQINIYKYDPEYVEDMNRPGWDAHLDIAERSRIMSKSEITFFRWYKSKERDIKGCPDEMQSMSEDEMKELYEVLTKRRSVSKTANYALTYNCGVPKLAESAKVSVAEAQEVFNGYWERNWSVKQFAEDQTVKTINGNMWILNPISKFWYPLTNEKDRFSAINQSSGVRVFDGWVYYVIKSGYKPIFQAHDEILLCIKEEDYENCQAALKKAMRIINKQFNFPVEIEIDIQKGKNYAEVH